MSTISISELKKKPASQWLKSAAKGDLVVTAKGQPVAVLLHIAAASVESTQALLRSVRALQAQTVLQQAAIANGTANLSLSDIDAEISRPSRPSPEMKIVLDTNIVVSGLLQSLGNPAQILTLALAGRVRVCYDERILAEYAEVLARPRFKFDQKRIHEVLAKLKADGLAVDAAPLADLDLPDPDDEPFLAVALAARADFLVTGNLADYPAGKRRGCTVVSPAEFMEGWRKIK